MEHRVKIEVNPNGAIRISKLIQTLNGNTIEFLFPELLQDPQVHVELINLSPIKAALKALSTAKPGQYRRPRIIITEDILKVYWDDIGNPSFQGELLEEIVKDEKEEERKEIKFQSLIDAVQNTKFRPKDAEKEFNLKPFDGKSNIDDFLNGFLEECDKHGVDSDDKKIEILRLFMKESALNWYEAAKRKIKDKDWEKWMDSLKKVFGNKNFASVRSVFNFQYKFGRLMDYALKKENLILDLDADTPEQNRIDWIVMGLPIPIQDKLNRHNLKTVDNLIQKLSDLDGKQSSIVNRQSSNTKTRNNPPQSPEKKPCSICLKLKKTERYHPESSCWFKPKINFISKEADDEDLQIMADQKN